MSSTSLSTSLETIRRVIDVILTKEYDLAPHLVKDGKLLMAIDNLDPIGFVATSLATCAPVKIKIGCIWNKIILYKRIRGSKWTMETIQVNLCIPDMLHRPDETSLLDLLQENWRDDLRLLVRGVMQYGTLVEWDGESQKGESWKGRTWLSIPVIVSRLLDQHGYPYVPYTLVIENVVGFIVSFNDGPWHTLVYVRASHVRIWPRTQMESIVLRSETLACLVPSEFSLGSIDWHHGHLVRHVLETFARRKDAERVFGLHLHIEPIDDSAFPSPKQVLEWIRQGRMHYVFDALKCCILIDKSPVCRIHLYILPGLDRAMDECLQWCEAAKDIKHAMDTILAEDAVVVIE